MPENQPTAPPSVTGSSGDEQQSVRSESSPVEKKYTQTMEPQKMAKRSSESIKTFIVAFIVVLLGIGTGYGLSKLGRSTSTTTNPTAANTPIKSDQIEVGTVYGSKVNGFTDEAEGVVIDGGINGEGTHRMLRPGGESQIICLTSDVIDLDLFVDHKVKIWGETFDTQKCGWFMNVGKVEPVELNAEKPFEPEEE